MTQIVTIARTVVRRVARVLTVAGRVLARRTFRFAQRFAWDLNRRRTPGDPQARVILPVFAIALVCLFLAGFVLGVS